MEFQTDDENTQQSILISNEEIDSRSLMEFMIANPCFIYGEGPGVLKCTIDGTVIKWKVKKGIEPLNRHLSTQRHIVALDLIEKKKQELILNEQRAVDFVLWMTTYNIPFSKIDEGFTNYLQNISGHIYYSRTHYIEEFLPSIYKKHLNNIRAYFDKNPYYIMLDESPDIKKRKILNILIGELSFELNAKPFLLNTVELENTTAAHIYDVILRELSLIHSEFKNGTNFKLLIPDRAAYCLALGKRLKESIKGIKHITCLCHALHNLCETIKDSKKPVLKVMRLLNSAFKRNKKNKKAFKRGSKLKFPKLPIKTRWGSYLQYVMFFCNNYRACLKGIINLPRKYNLLKEKFDSDEFKRELQEFEEFEHLIVAIKRLENSNLTVFKNLEILKTVRERIDRTEFKGRLDQILNGNPDLSFFYNYLHLTCDEKDKIFKFAPVTSCWVERSFSKYKLICSPLRTNLRMSVIAMLLFFFFNARK